YRIRAIDAGRARSAGVRARCVRAGAGEGLARRRPAERDPHSGSHDETQGTRLKRALLVPLLGTLLLLCGGCSPFFAIRASYEEAKILSRRQSITRMIADPAVPVGQRAKLQLVLSVRDFADESLGLDAGESYTTFSQLDS